MNDDEEILALRAEIKRLVHAALNSDAHHVAEMDRRDQLHIAEVERRDKLHDDEMRRLDDIHETEIHRRGEIHEHEMDALRHALETRDLIGQAKGVLMATLGCSPDEAFTLLRKQSQHENRKLVEIAAEIARRAAKHGRPPT